MGRPMKLFVMLLSIAMLGVIQYTRMLNIWHRSTDHVIITPNITNSVHQVERDPNHTDHMMTYVEPHHEDELRTLFYQELLVARNLVLNYSRSNKFYDPCEGGNKVNKVLHHTRDEESPIRYINDVSKYVTGSITVLWKRIEPRSVPVFQYYRPASTNCVYLEHRSIGKPINLTECTHDTNTTLTNNTDNRTIWTYVSVLPNAVVDSDGYVISNQVKLSEMSCHSKANSNCFSKTKEVYDEVFTITQYWGGGFFHGTIENIPRLAPFIPFLLQNPEIKIHAAAYHPFMPLLGINKTRVVGGTVSARLVYQPEGTRCGTVDYFNVNTLAKALKRGMENSTQVRDTIVLIQRSHKRLFNYHDDIKKMLTKYANELNLRVFVFNDRDLPPATVTRDIFNRALVIVAPHGAGESNMVFSQPGTVLIEGLCYAAGQLNLCYQHTARMLGLRYYGMAYTYDCRQITAEDVEKPFVRYMRLLGYL